MPVSLLLPALLHPGMKTEDSSLSDQNMCFLSSLSMHSGSLHEIMYTVFCSLQSCLVSTIQIWLPNLHWCCLIGSLLMIPAIIGLPPISTVIVWTLSGPATSLILSYIPRQVAGRFYRDLDGLFDVPLQVPWRSVIYPYSPSIFHDCFPFLVPYLSTRCNVILYLMYLAITPLRWCHLYYSLYPDIIIE